MNSGHRSDLVDEQTARQIFGEISSDMMKQLRLKHRIPFYKLGYRTIRYSRSDLEDYLQKTRIRSRE